MHQVKINWVNMIKEHTVKTNKLADYDIPYDVLVSKFIEYFEVYLEDELVETIKPHNEVTAATLNKIGLNKINDDHWICRDDEQKIGQQGNEGEGAGQQEDEGEPSAIATIRYNAFFRMHL